jgi:hypothetical protein
MGLATRRVIWFAVTDRPDAAWVTQQATAATRSSTAPPPPFDVIFEPHRPARVGVDRTTWRAQLIEIRADLPDLDAKIERGESPRSSPGYIEMCTATPVCSRRTSYSNVRPESRSLPPWIAYVQQKLGALYG